MITDENILRLIMLIKHEPVDFMSIDHHALISAAKLHRVTGLIYRALLTYSSAPQKLLDLFKESSKKNQYKALQQLNLLSKINRLLSQNNIPMLCIKGVILSYQLYGDIGVRISNDIDIFVSKKNIFAIDLLLKQLGFQALHCQHSFETQNINDMLAVFKDIGYYHPKDDVIVEVHCQLLSPPLGFYHFDELWDKRQVVQLPGGEKFNILPRDQEWLYLCIHGSYHCYMRLQWLCDIVNYHERYLSLNVSNQWHEKIDQFKIRHYYNLALFFIDIFNHCPSVSPHAKKQFYYRFSCKLMQRRKTELSVGDNIMIRLFYWLSADGSREKLKLIYYYAKPTFALLKTKINIPQWLFFLYVPFYYIVFVPMQIAYRLAHKIAQSIPKAFGYISVRKILSKRADPIAKDKSGN